MNLGNYPHILRVTTNKNKLKIDLLILKLQTDTNFVTTKYNKKSLQMETN